MRHSQLIDSISLFFSYFLDVHLSSPKSGNRRISAAAAAAATAAAAAAATAQARRARDLGELTHTLEFNMFI